MNDRHALEQTSKSLADVISQAKAAAAKAGVATDGAGSSPEDQAAYAIHEGRTSFAFELDGLKNATMIQEIEEALHELEGVDAKIVYPNSMAWVSASTTIDPNSIVEVFERFGVGAALTDSSLRRRMAWSDVEEGRRRRAKRGNRRRRTAEERMPHGERSFERARREGFLHDQKRRASRETPTEVLFTARQLVTRRRFIISLLLSIPVLTISFSPQMQFNHWQWLVALLSAPVVFYGAWPFHRATLGGARRGMSALDSASSVAIVMAWAWSLTVLVVTPLGDVAYRANPTWSSLDAAMVRSGLLFFDVACGMTCILLAGRLFIRRARNSLLDDLARYRPNPSSEVTVMVRDRKKSTMTKVRKSVHKLNVGEDVLIGPGEVIPVDGQVVGGSSEIDATALGIAGFHVKVNDKVYAGCINGSKNLKVRVSNTGHRTWLAEIHRWVADTNLHQNRLDDIATKAASTLVPVSFMIAAADFALWALLTGNLNQAFATALAVLGCVGPVSLAVSAALPIRQGIEGAARRGVLVRSGNTLRAIDQVDTVIFNRVGALSGGEMTVETVTADRGENPDLVLRVAGALALESDHPVSRALVRAARESRDATVDKSAKTSWIEVHHYELDEEGNFHAMIELPVTSSEGEEERRQTEAVLWRPKNLSELHGRLAAAAVSGGTPLVVRWKGKDRGVITLRDAAKEDALEAVDQLETQGIETMMLSRDTYPVARRYGDSVGVSHVLAGIQPAHKAQTVRSVRTLGYQLAMVGDSSVNRCFRVANVGIQLGAMKDVVVVAELDHSAADVVILDDAVSPIPWLFGFARKISRVVHTNLVFAWTYNVVALTAAVVGVLHPMLATLCMLVSSLVIEVRSNRVGSQARVGWGAHRGSGPRGRERQQR